MWGVEVILRELRAYAYARASLDSILYNGSNMVLPEWISDPTVIQLYKKYSLHFYTFNDSLLWADKFMGASNHLGTWPPKFAFTVVCSYYC